MRYVSASTFAYNIREKENLTRLISIESQPKKVVVVTFVVVVEDTIQNENDIKNEDDLKKKFGPPT